MPRINYTTDHGRFDFQTFNREISWKNVREIASSMGTDGFRDNFPILVIRRGDKLIIVDGHHRFYAAKSLGIPIKYTVMDCSVETAAQIMISHAITNRPWTIRDCAELHRRRGKKSYQELLDYHDRTGISITQSAALVGGGGGKASGGEANNVKSGEFKVGDQRLANDVERIVDAIAVEMGRQAASRGALVHAIAGLCCVDVFDADRMIGQLRHKRAKAKLTEFPTKKLNVQMLEAIYNHASTAKTALVIPEQQVSSARRRSKGDRRLYSENDKYRIE